MWHIRAIVHLCGNRDVRILTITVHGNGLQLLVHESDETRGS